MEYKKRHVRSVLSDLIVKKSKYKGKYLFVYYQNHKHYIKYSHGRNYRNRIPTLITSYF